MSINLKDDSLKQNKTKIKNKKNFSLFLRIFQFLLIDNYKYKSTKISKT